MSIFSKAKSKKTTTKKVEKTTVVANFETEEEAKLFDKQLKEFADLKKQIDTLTAKFKSLDVVIKEKGMEEFVKLLETTGKRESSYTLETVGGANVLVTVQDKYKTIDSERADYLNETYEEADLVNEDTVYSFNMKVLERNQDVISQLIEDCEEITDEDKENLLFEKTTYSVKKGTIDKIYKISQDLDVDVETLIDEISPVMSLKNPKTK